MSQGCVCIRDQFDLLIPLIHTALPPLYFLYQVLNGALRRSYGECEMHFSIVDVQICLCYLPPETGREKEPSDVLLRSQ